MKVKHVVKLVGTEMNVISWMSGLTLKKNIENADLRRIVRIETRVRLMIKKVD